MALELWKSSRGMAASGGMFSGSDVSKRRSTVAWRGPAYGLRPVCCGSCWYIGLPTAAGDAWGFAEGDAAANGDGAAAAADDGEVGAAGWGFAEGGAVGVESDAPG